MTTLVHLQKRTAKRENREIEDDAVPEWRDKYVNYKVGWRCDSGPKMPTEPQQAGKKLIKQVSRSVRDSGTPPGPLLSPSPSSTPLLLPLPEPALDLPPRKRAVRNVGNIGNKLREYAASSAPNSTAPAAANKGTPQSRAEVEDKKHAFVTFLDAQCSMVEDFYREKEEESTERLSDIREQLHLLRAQRTRERARPPGRAREAIRPIGKPIKSAVKKVRFGSAASKSEATSFTPPSADVGQRTHQSDYVKRNDNQEISYAHAKRHLKRAMVVFYQSLEMLKSYAIVNHKAFRKINKKYDKATRDRHPMRYFSEKITKAYFVQSEVVDSHIKTVEDLYARYFEGDSRKLAVGKLRRKHHELGEYTTSMFRNGLMFAAGFVLGVEALYYAGVLLFDDDAAVTADTSYLLQLYGGYFLMLLLMMLFAGCCGVFEAMRINYVFVFELDVRHNVNWRQMFELPCFFFLLLGLTMLLNFMRVGGQQMYIFWPVVLIGSTLLTIFLPIKYFYWRPRLWFANSLRRLVMAPLPRVEFRDFFLGDMFCSQAYAMGNISLFFCLYANDWDDPAQCNSSHSRLLGFFSALPGVWRLLQCLRRYHDTRNVFPHLVNAGKYTFTFMQYASLSIFRISRTNNTFAAFVAISTINSVYCFIWDVLMDWSLGNSSARHKFLRPQLAYERVYWIYYLAIVEDFILRFGWIFYAIFRNEVQHSAILSFFVGLAEVCRRGIWVLFRVENEHCANIVHNRAIKDMSLPYEPRVSKALERRQSESQADMTDEEQSLHSSLVAMRRQNTHTSATSTGRSGPNTPQTVARSPSIGTRVGHALSRAHTQDFERRRDDYGGSLQLDDDDDDDDDDNDEDYNEQYEAEDYEESQHEANGGKAPFSLDSSQAASAEASDAGEGSSGGDDSSSRQHRRSRRSQASSSGAAPSVVGVSAVQVQVRAGKPRPN